MTDAEIRKLIKRHTPSERYVSESRKVLKLANDYLALKAAVRLVHGAPSRAQAFIGMCAAKGLLDQVAKEPTDD